MSRRLVSLAVLLAVAVGAVADDDEPGEVYTIKFREKQAGDRYEVTYSGSSTTTTTVAGPGGKMSETERTGERLEYTEAVLGFPAGADRPTRLTRTYKVAQRTAEKSGPKPAKPKVRAASYQGKTVTIEKAGAGYTFRVDGKDLPPAEAGDFRTEFGKDPKARPGDLLPTGPVRLGEGWTPGPVALKALAAEVPWPVDVDRSRITGRLTRVYAEGGRQLGVTAFRTELAVGGGPGPSGGLTVEVTVDTAIDGSATGGTTRKSITGTLTERHGEVDVRVVLDVRREQTVRPVK